MRKFIAVLLTVAAAGFMSCTYAAEGTNFMKNPYAVEDVYFSDSDGNETDSIANAKVANVTVKRSENSTKSGRVILCAYSADNDLLCVKTISQAVAAGERKTVSAPFDVPSGKSAACIKAYVWAGENDTEPLSAVTAVSINASGKIEALAGSDDTLEFAPSEYESCTMSKGEICFNSTSYRLSPFAEFTVNGVRYDAGLSDNILNTILSNAQGKIKLAEKTSDGYMRLSAEYYDIARISGVSYEDGELKLTLNCDRNALVPIKTITLSDYALEMGRVDLSVEFNGLAIEPDELEKGDVIAYAIDVNTMYTDITDPEFIKISATRNKVKGMITEYDFEDDVYTVNGKKYKASLRNGALVVGETYVLILDPFARIFDCEAVDTSTYAIVEKWNAAAETLTLVLADGTHRNFELAANISITDSDGSYLGSISDILYDSTYEKKPFYERVVRYTLKSFDTSVIRKMEVATPIMINNCEYKASVEALGSIRLSAETKIIDASDYIDAYNPTASDYVSIARSYLIDGNRYDGYAFKTNGMSTYSFVILTRMGEEIGKNSNFAVFRGVKSQLIHNDEDALKAEVLTCGSAENLYYYNGDCDAIYTDVGDVIFYLIDRDGFVKNTFKVFDAAEKRFYDFSQIGSMYGMYDAYDWNFSLYDNGADNQLVYAVVTAADENSVTLAPIPDEDGDIDVNGGVTSQTAVTGAEVYTFVDDAFIYIYDTADEAAKYEYRKIKTASKVPPSDFSAFETYAGSGVYSYFADKNNNGVYDSETDLLREDFTNYAVALIKNGEISDIHIIKK